MSEQEQQIDENNPEFRDDPQDLNAEPNPNDNPENRDGEPGEETGTGEGDDDDGELTITIGDEEPKDDEHGSDSFQGQPAPQWVKDLRKSEREYKRRVKELEAQIQAKSQPEQQQDQQITLGKKPTLEDFDYDADAYEQALENWHEQKIKFQQQQADQIKQQEEANKQWEATVASYNEKKAALKVRDFEEVEQEIQDKLDIQKQGMILQGAENPARVIYALGKNPKKLEELAAITDPVKFAFAVAKMETQMKDVKRKPSTAPEKTMKGSGSLSGAVDTTLEKLRAEAEKTGDFTKVFQYKKQMKQQN